MANLVQTVYDHIRGRIASGEWTNQTALSEPSLAQELKTSRTPIREAMYRLEMEGLLERRPKLGTFIRTPSRLEMRELFTVRILFEPYAAAQAARKRSPDLLAKLSPPVDKMKQLLPLLEAKGSLDEKVSLCRENALADQAFHEAILTEAGNRCLHRLVSLAGVLAVIWSLPKDRPLSLLHNLRQAAREHGRIFNAIRRGDATTARKAMREHLVRGRKHALAYFDWLESQTAAQKTSSTSR